MEQAGLLLDAALAARDPPLANAAPMQAVQQANGTQVVPPPHRSANHFMFTVHLHHMGTSNERDRRKSVLLSAQSCIEISSCSSGQYALGWNTQQLQNTLCTLSTSACRRQSTTLVQYLIVDHKNYLVLTHTLVSMRFVSYISNAQLIGVVIISS